MESESGDLLVAADEQGVRLDRFLSSRFPRYSRSYFQYLIQENLVLVNGELIKKGAKLREGDEVEVEFAVTPELTLTPEPIPLDILYEDTHLLAINKPAGMVVHPAVGNWTGTFVHALLYHCMQKRTAEIRPGIVHRLDKDTSGVLLAAKDENTQRLLVEAFAKRAIYKEYLGVCVGNPGVHRKIESNIGRHPTRRKEMAVLTEKGKAAETLCDTIAYKAPLSLVRLLPRTGRTHQLRVHLQSIGTPILGDNLYGNTGTNKKWNVNRQLLHAYRLRFLHPITQASLELSAPPPADLQHYITLLGGGSLL